MSDASPEGVEPDAPASGAPAPLTGVRIVDLTQNLAGPYATQILADLGADVVKVEPPAGDPARSWGPPFVDGQSPLFLCGNRNKRSIVVDLATDEGRAVLRDLATDADVFVQAFRAGVAERLGFGYDDVRRLSPRVLYVSVTAFGTEGPLREQPGYDPLMQAYAGLMSVTGHPGGPPARVGTSIVDMGTGMWTAIAILAALHERQRERAAGREVGPRRITTSLLDTALAWMAYHVQGYAASGDTPGPMGTGLGMIVPYEAFPAADGQLMIAAGNDGSFRRLCDALDLDDIAADDRFAGNPGRVAHRAELVARLSERTRQESVAGLVERLQAAGVPCAPLLDVAGVVRDRQVEASGMLRPVAGTGAGAGPLDVATPVRWDGQRAPVRRPPPGVGEHSEEILRELGRAP